ncbi:MAG TPA: DUF3488 and transglutaminase-like domain-containing protein, partial [Bryobacteraceae bacterium]|nr:DUF3488 and transglutaminase-like domain-containing protein [Bryobacteraceae bacterium]
RGFKRFPAQLGLLSAAVTVGVLVLTAGLFFLLPRTADAAFSRLLAHRVYLPGFSDQVTLGEYGEIKTSSRPVMHVSIFSRTVPPGLKWRGGALAHFDGKRWSNPDPQSEAVPVENGEAALDAEGPARSGRQMNYQVQLEAVDTDALFLAGIPEKIAMRRPFLLFRNDTGGIHLNRVPPVGFRYEVRSLLEDPPETAPPPDRAVVLGLARRNRYLQLPPLDARIPQLARNMTQGATTDLERSRALERRLRSDYGYTLELPSHEIADPLAYFLFQKKKGYCEYFASAMAVMLRTLGIPSRLATGFLTGEYNPISGLWLVRASDAHAWVEAWIPGYGWTTFDPTPPDLNPPTFSLLTQLGLYLDASQTFWQEWVVGYDIGRQGVLTDRLQQGVRRMGIRWFDSLTGLESDDWKAQVGTWGRRFGGGAAGVLSLGALVWLLGPPVIRRLRLRRRVSRVRRGRAATGDATLLYGRMLHILKRRGYQKPPWFTPAEFAASLPRTPLGLSVAEFTDTYNAWRFGGKTDVAPRLSTLLDELERQEP